MYVRRSVVATAMAGALALSACGTSSDGTAAQVPGAPTPTETEVVDSVAPEATDAPVATLPVATAAGNEAEPEPVATEAPAATEAPVLTEPPAPTPPPAEVGGRAFAEALSSGSDIATNSLPDLLVDDIRRGAKINLRNVFPADRPVLIWMWAPH